MRGDYDYDDDYCVWAEIGEWLQGLLIAAGAIVLVLAALVLAAKFGLLWKVLP